MNKTVLFTLLLVIVVLCVYMMLIHRNIEYFTDTVISDDVIEAGQERFNKFANLVSIANPQLPLSPQSLTAVDQATNSMEFGGGLPGAYIPLGGTPPYKIPSSEPNSLNAAQTICETINTSDCTAFQNPAFVANCGISFDLKGKNSKGQPHIGGLYISANDKSFQEEQAKRMNLSPDDVRYSPTLGTSAKGQFAVDQASCQVLSEQIACVRTRDLGTDNCAQCFNSSAYNRIDPSTPRIPPSLILQTNAATLSVQTATTTVTVPVSASNANTPLNIDVPGLVEGSPLIINATQTDPTLPLYVAGFISAQTAKGSFNLDINALISLDTVTNYRQRLQGTSTVSFNNSNVTCFNLRPGVGQTTMNLTGMMPFSFLSPFEYDARSCDNGPFVTMPASASFLNTDVCYDPSNNKPGAYSLACLQQLFMGFGGTTSGTGYPSTVQAANANLNIDPTGKPRSLADIGTFLTSMAVQAATGMDNGQEIPISQWNIASLFMTGQSILGPCDEAVLNNQPVTPQCLNYLYTNGGVQDSRIGPTYSLGPSYASVDLCGNAVYCTPDGTLNPATQTGVTAANQAMGSSVGTAAITAVQQLYDTAHKTANNNTLINSARRPALQQCYGTNLRAQNAEVFWVGGSSNDNMFTQDQAQSVCSALGADVASTAQVRAAQGAGAQWCSSGWVTDSNPYGIYPMQANGVPGCGSSGISEWGATAVAGQPPAIGVNCYGAKPAQNAVPSGYTIAPFTTVYQPDASQPGGWNYNAGSTWNDPNADQ